MRRLRWRRLPESSVRTAEATVLEARAELEEQLAKLLTAGERVAQPVRADELERELSDTSARAIPGAGGKRGGGDKGF